MVNESAQDILQQLRQMPSDDATLIDQATPLIQVLTFTMTALMDDQSLETFVNQTLKPSTYPIDGLVFVRFQKEFADYAETRKLTVLSEDELRLRVERLTQSQHAATRVGALAMLADPHWNVLSNNEIQGIVQAMNALAKECPSCTVTREAFHELIRVCSGPALQHPEMVKALFEQIPWNQAMRNIMATDPVIAVVQQAITPPSEAKQGELTGLDALLYAARNNPYDDVRDFCLRLASSTQTMRDNQTVTGKEQIRETLATVAAETTVSSSTTKSLSVDSTLTSIRFSLPETRAKLILFASAIDDKDLAAAEPYLNDMAANLIGDRSVVPFDLNMYERITRKVGFYAFALVDKGRYQEAIDVFNALIQAYPNSMLADHYQQKIAHLETLLE